MKSKSGSARKPAPQKPKNKRPKAKIKTPPKIKAKVKVRPKAIVKSGRKAKASPPPAPQPKIEGKSGPRLDIWQRDHLVMLLASGQRERLINDYFRLMGWGELASSTLSYYRQEYHELIEEATAARIDGALTAGLALKSERIAALKDHAEMLGGIRFAPGKTGRLFNEKAWRETLEDIAIEMGDRRRKDEPQEQTVKVYVGIDPDKV